MAFLILVSASRFLGCGPDRPKLSSGHSCCNTPGPILLYSASYLSRGKQEGFNIQKSALVGYGNKSKIKINPSLYDPMWLMEFFQNSIPQPNNSIIETEL